MSSAFEVYLVGAALLLILSVVASKISDRFGIPALILFLATGMLAGSDGFGGIYFDDPFLAQSLGVVALVIILFSGGLDTNWQAIRSAAREGIILATLGVLLTALSVGVFVHALLDVSLLEGLLIGSIVSSTDAAAVFAVLRARGISLRGRLKPLLELESGSNDPMAVFLTISLARLIAQPGRSPVELLPLFLQQMVLGVLAGLLASRLILFMVNRLRFGYSGLYPVLMTGMVFLTYGLTALMGGSGFLAVYLVGLLMGKEDFLHKRSMVRFFDGIAWMMQIIMFLTLGLLVFPSRLVGVILPGLAISLFLIVVARPLSVFLSLAFNRMPKADKTFIAWVGLRGAVPIVLATYPRIMGLEHSDLIFNVIFFVVLSSVLVQGTSIPWVARRLGVEGKGDEVVSYPLEDVSGNEWKGKLAEAVVPEGSWAIGKAIYELGLPGDYLVVLIARGSDFVIPNGSVVLQAGDRLLGLSGADAHTQVDRLLQKI